MKRKSLLILYVWVIILFFQYGCGQKAIKIGVVLEFSGPALPYSQSLQKGILLAIDHVNKEGGVDNRPVVALFKDAGESKEHALRVVQELRDEGVHVIIGATTSTMTLVVGKYCQENHIILMSPAASSPQISYLGDFVYRNFPSDQLEGYMMAHFMREKVGISKVAVAYIQNDYGLDLYRVFATEFRKLHGSIEMSIGFDETEESLKSVVRAFLHDRPQNIYLIGYANELVELLKGIRAGYTPEWIFSVGGFATPHVLKKGGTAVEDVIFFQPEYDPNSKKPIVRKFVRAFEERYGAVPDIYAAHAYDAVRILVQVMRLFGTRVEDIQMGLNQTRSFRGVAGRTSFDENGDVIRFPKPYIVQGQSFVPLDEPLLRNIIKLKTYKQAGQSQ